MTRVMRYPRMSVVICLLAVACALGRDVCVGFSLDGWASVLLAATLALLALGVLLMSCRFLIDEQGVGVGCMLRMRRVNWDNVAAMGVLCCNSRRRYLYGMYRGRTDFLDLLHRAPRCGSWGFVVPTSDRMMRAVLRNCPFGVDLSSLPVYRREGKLRMLWHHAALYLLLLIPGAALAAATGALMLIQASKVASFAAAAGGTLCALAMFAASMALFQRVLNTISTCPGFSEQGVCAGRGAYVPWEDVRFGYVHRIAKMSGMFMLSQPLDVVTRRGAPPMICLSMPDTSTLLLAYLTYCPHASKGDMR